MALEQYPIDFCQCNGDAFVMTQPMTLQPYRLKSTLEDELRGSGVDTQHTFTLHADEVKTLLYEGPEQFGASTYAEGLSGKTSLLTQEALISVFTPAKSIRGIKYNYVIDVD